MLNEALEATAPAWPWLRTPDDRRKRRCRALNVGFFAFIASAQERTQALAFGWGQAMCGSAAREASIWSHSSSNARRGRRSAFCLLDWQDA